MEKIEWKEKSDVGENVDSEIIRRGCWQDRVEREVGGRTAHTSRGSEGDLGTPVSPVGISSRGLFASGDRSGPEFALSGEVF